MNLLPLLYVLLAALTGLSPVGMADEPRTAASAVERRVAVVAARLIAARPVRSFEVLRDRPAMLMADAARGLSLAILPKAERPARRRE